MALGTPAQKGTFQIALNKYAERVLGMIEMELTEEKNGVRKNDWTLRQYVNVM